MKYFAAVHFYYDSGKGQQSEVFEYRADAVAWVIARINAEGAKEGIVIENATGKGVTFISETESKRLEGTK